MKRNLGQCSLRRRRRRGDPMTEFDRLPGPLRRWLSEAALPWSPASARRIWTKLRAQGHSVTEALQTLSRIEAQMLTRETKGAQRRA